MAGLSDNSSALEPSPTLPVLTFAGCIFQPMTAVRVGASRHTSLRIALALSSVLGAERSSFIDSQVSTEGAQVKEGRGAMKARSVFAQQQDSLPNAGATVYNLLLSRHSSTSQAHGGRQASCLSTALTERCAALHMFRS